MPQQVFATNSLGGYWSQPWLDSKVRSLAQPMYKFRQFIDAKQAFGKNRGDTFLFDKTKNVDTQGGTLVETSTIPETQFQTVQGSATVTEYGNAVPWTGKLQDLGQFQIEPITEQKLRDDQVKVLESACGAELVKTDFVAVCTATGGVAFTTNSVATATATSNLTAVNVRAIVDYLQKKFVPPYDGQNFVCIASVGALSGMHSDTGTGGWVDVAKYSPEYSKNIFNGEVGNFYMTRFVKETGYLSNAIGNSSAYGQAIFLGQDNCIEAVAVPEEIRVDVPKDFGRDMKMAWYALLGFKLVWNYATDGEQHVIFVTSA